MSQRKSTVPVDEDLVTHIQIAAMHLEDKQDYDRHSRFVVITTKYELLLKDMAASKQFTPEQQAELQRLIATSNEYLGVKGIREEREEQS